MEVVYISFAALRATSVAVAELVQEECGVEYAGFEMDLENDLGITGADGVELMDKLSRQFKVDLRAFQSDQYFNPEPSGPNFLIFIWVLLVAVVLAIQLCLVGFTFLFSCAKGKQMWENSLHRAGADLDEMFQVDSNWLVVNELKVSDLIASAVKGKFVQRQHITFRLKRG